MPQFPQYEDSGRKSSERASSRAHHACEEAIVPTGVFPRPSCNEPNQCGLLWRTFTYKASHGAALRGRGVAWSFYCNPRFYMNMFVWRWQRKGPRKVAFASRKCDKVELRLYSIHYTPQRSRRSRARAAAHISLNSACVGNSVEVADGGMRMRSMRLPAAEVLALPLQRLA